MSDDSPAAVPDVTALAQTIRYAIDAAMIGADGKRLASQQLASLLALVERQDAELSLAAQQQEATNGELERTRQERDEAQASEAEIRRQHTVVMAAIKGNGLSDGDTEWRDDEYRTWEYHLERTVECPDCAFTFGAGHTLEGGSYTCPACGEIKARDIAARYERYDVWQGVVAENMRLERELDEARATFKAQLRAGTEDVRRERDAAQEALRISYPKTPVDCLISELRDEYAMFTRGATRERFEERVAQFHDETALAAADTPPEPT